MLNASSLCITRSNKEVLSGISFRVEVGEVYALLGGNGAGKSTTLLSFLGFLQPSSGQVQVNGKEVHADTASARQQIAYLPESASLYEHLNAYENIRYFLQLANTKVAQTEIESALDDVSLVKSARQQHLQHYSKGMRQKVAIALAILRNTNIMLLDEPISGLDPSAIDEYRFQREAEELRFSFVQGLNKAHVENLSYQDDINRNKDQESWLRVSYD